MTKELQNLTWSVLPKEFKEEVKKEYARCVKIDADDNPNLPAYAVKSAISRRLLLEKLFGEDNLTSDAEGEEMLTCVKDQAVKLYDIANKAYAINGDEYYEGYTNAMIDLFGSKCLPDAHEINFASKEQEHDYTPNGCTHPNKENCRWKDKSLDCNLKNGCYYEPKPAEPKFKVGDTASYVCSPTLKHKCTVTKVMQNEHSGKWEYNVMFEWGKPGMWIPESDLEPYAEPKINTFKDLRKSGKYNRYLLCNDRYQEIALECMNPYERKMFATGIIAQLKEYYGGMVPFPQPIRCAKIVLCPDAEKFEVDIYRDWDALMTFHNIEQAERFLKYNEQLVRDYYMLPRKEESC